MEEDSSEGRLFATFEKREEFLRLQNSLLSLDITGVPAPDEDKEELFTLEKLSVILNEYQEQSHLLDPFLEELVSPVAQAYKSHAVQAISSDCNDYPVYRRALRLSSLLYQYIKYRGYKTITRCFPHEIADLSVTLQYLTVLGRPDYEFSHWTARYIALLWLSIICMIPFDLAQFDEEGKRGTTASTIESIGRKYLRKAGPERDAAALVLAKLFMRKDTMSCYPAFLEWSGASFQDPIDLFASIGILQVICEVLKGGSVAQIRATLAETLSVASAIDNAKSLLSNTLQDPDISASKVLFSLEYAALFFMVDAGQILGQYQAEVEQDFLANDSEEEVPEEVEPVLQVLFESLQDKDTIVRWSAAKGIARIAERLPVDFSEQVLDTVVGLFSIHSMAAASMYDMPTIAESTWHGACLACAELARRGLVPPVKLPSLLEWLFKALSFDIQKGAYSIGANVRDSAAYVLWALARAQSQEALAPHALDLARRLVAAAVFDREIQIRRAASAAFQEYVGRTGLFPHGIDVLGKTDFYAIGIRAHAFKIAAPEVAEHEEYRSFLINHLLGTTLRHWDSMMRRLGAESLQIISEIDIFSLGPEIGIRASNLLVSTDIADIHGGLLALTELAGALRKQRKADKAELLRRELFGYINRVPRNVVEAARNELITAATCDLIGNSITYPEVQLHKQSVVRDWKDIVEYGLRHRSTAVQDAAARAMAAISGLVDCSADVDRLIPQFLKGAPHVQQSICHLLGVLTYDIHRHSLDQAVKCLLGCVSQSSRAQLSNVEARRNCYTSMSQIICTVAAQLPAALQADQICDMLDALLRGLEDYSMDERGDVGSWIRVACIRGLTRAFEALFRNLNHIPDFVGYCPPLKYHSAVGGILRQGVARLDNVRQEAGQSFLCLLQLPLPATVSVDLWRIHGDSLMRELFLNEQEHTGWQDSSWLYPKAIQLLGVQPYRSDLLSGLIQSIGSKTDSTRRPASASLVAYADGLPVSASTKQSYDLLRLVSDLIKLAKANVTLNNIVIPVLQTLEVLIEAEQMDRLLGHQDGLASLREMIVLVAKNIGRIKNVQRVQDSMKILTHLAFAPPLLSEAAPYLKDLLIHQFPKIRTETAEHIYLILQSKDLDLEQEQMEELLLETDWSDIDAARNGSERLIRLLSRHGSDDND